MTKRFCNKCGKEIDEHYENISIKKRIGYGSVHDDDDMDLNLCCECLDEMIAWLRPQCKRDFLIERDL